jgi:hypothetical protein
MTQNEENQYIKVCFKLARSLIVKYYLINPYWAISEMYENLRPKIETDFQLTNFEIIETGQNIPGIFAEDAPALELTDNMILWAKFGHYMNVSFYIRSKNRILCECDECATIAPTMHYFGCQHEYCYGCVNYYRISVNDMCPICKW